MYCKKCGRKLRSEARFCDHCGHSTKEVKEPKTTKTTKSTSGTKSNSGSKATAGRSNYGESDGTRSAYARNKKRRELERQRVKRNRKIAFFAILFAIVLATVLGFVSYNMMKPVPDENKENETVSTIDLTGEEDAENPEATEEAEETQDDEEVTAEDEEKSTPEPTETLAEKSKKSESEKEQEKKDYKAVAAECNIYKDDRMDDISCPYPKNFEQGSKANKNTVISLIDPLNDGSVMICAEVVGTGKSPATLMNSYADGLGVKLSESDSGDNWYEVSFERNNKTNHRKAVIANGLCVYYDFSYDVDSGESENYEKYIEYMDYYLEEEAKSLAKEENAKK